MIQLRRGGREGAPPRGSALSFAVLLALAVWLAPSSHGDEVAKPNGAYCGINALYAIACLSDTPVTIESLMRPEYADYDNGSTLGQLRDAARDAGFNAVPVGGLTPAVLKRSPYPMILRYRETDGPIGHYVAFLGARDGQAVIQDPPSPPRPMPLEVLAAQWDGTALVVSKEPIDTARLFLPGRLKVGLGAAAALAVALLLRELARRTSMGRRLAAVMKPKWRAVGQAAAIAALGAAMGFAYHATAQGGFYRGDAGMDTFAWGHLAEFLPRVSREQVSRRPDTAVLLDARREVDYKLGHLPGAINVSVDLSPEETLDMLADVDKDRPIIVYCQSERCDYAVRIARRLLEGGYHDIALYEGGWLAWEGEEAT